MAKFKLIKRQDAGLKITPGNSGETSINLSTEIADYICDTPLNKEETKAFTFVLYKEDFIRAICRIVEKLPLYESTSKEYHVVNNVKSVFVELNQQIHSFFGDNDIVNYSCSIYRRNDGRTYLNALATDSFSIRNFLIENISFLKFDKLGDEVHVRIVYDINDEKHSEETWEMLESTPTVRDFASLCVEYFSKQDNWSNIEKYISPTTIEAGGLIKITDGCNFNLSGMFRCTTEEGLVTYNTPARRWFTDPYTIKGKTVFLSTQWCAETKANGESYDLMISDLEKFIPICFGEQYICKRNGKNFELWIKRQEDRRDVRVLEIDKCVDALKQTGLIYTDQLIKRFISALLTKPFVILSGLAGSGKTQLAIALARCLSETKDQYKVISVGADWTNREPLLGYPNALKSNEYVMPENGALELIIDANANPTKPYFLILDEMNLSYVERYFADFLSALESHEEIALWNGDSIEVPASIPLPKNLFIIGTINVDETTYMFSPKVLDRASVIEFKVNSDEMDEFLTQAPIVDISAADGKAANMAQDFVVKATEKIDANANDIKETLLKFFKELKGVNAEFGYRSAIEIARFVAIATNNGMSLDDSIDAAIVQKLLPKLHGSRKKLVPVLKTLWSFCGCTSNLDDAIDANNAIYKLTADKILRMYNSAIENGFTSFAEA